MNSATFKVIDNRTGFLWAKDASFETACAIAEEEANENLRDVSVLNQETSAQVRRMRVIGDWYIEESVA